MEELTLKKAQRIVDEWINQFEEGYWPPLSMLASLIEEVGELAREINAREKIKKKKETLTLSTAKAGRFLLLRRSSVGCSSPF
jgi:NTP pyrophosphatase (non-canonical NTP hydrolase)